MNLHPLQKRKKSGTYLRNTAEMQSMNFRKRQKNEAPHTISRGMTTGRPLPLPKPRHLTVIAVNTKPPNTERPFRTVDHEKIYITGPLHK